MAASMLALPAGACASSRRPVPSSFVANAALLRAPAPLRASQHQPKTAGALLQHRQRPSLLCRAEGEQQPSGEQQQAAQQQEQPASAAPKRPPVEDPTVAKGQRTAIVTGAISIIFGVIYLGLVSFLDIRGGELLPPPPEAYIP